MTNDQTVTQALEPCPFCGGEAEWRDDPGVCGLPFGLVVDHAPSCFLGIPMSEEAMVAAWNTRTAQSGEGREGAEHCRKCGRDNPSWSAPSPLWNAVMRGGSIDGNPIHDDLVCPSCFIGLAMEADIASGWRLIATEVNVPLETVTPSGRAWDDAAFLWDEQHSSHSGEGRSNGAGEVRAVRDDQCNVEFGTVPDCDCPHEHWHIGGVCLDVHIEEDGSGHSILGNDDWQLEVKGVESIDEMRAIAFAWTSQKYGFAALAQPEAGEAK